MDKKLPLLLDDQEKANSAVSESFVRRPRHCGERMTTARYQTADMVIPIFYCGVCNAGLSLDRQEEFIHLERNGLFDIGEPIENLDEQPDGPSVDIPDFPRIEGTTSVTYVDPEPLWRAENALTAPTAQEVEEYRRNRLSGGPDGRLRGRFVSFEDMDQPAPEQPVDPEPEDAPNQITYSLHDSLYRDSFEEQILTGTGHVEANTEDDEESLDVMEERISTARESRRLQRREAERLQEQMQRALAQPVEWNPNDWIEDAPTPDFIAREEMERWVESLRSVENRYRQPDRETRSRLNRAYRDRQQAARDAEEMERRSDA